MFCRAETDTKILLDEIETLVIENQQVSITAALLSELIEHKVRVVFCDGTHNPQSELVPYHGSYNTSARIKAQIAWTDEMKDLVWQEIIKQKIHNQAAVLKQNHLDQAYSLLSKYESEVESGDVTNREGLAAKSYFQALFGTSFDRRKASDKRNTFLDYGYSILLATCNREISAAGYLSALGIHHIGDENPFNLGCDLMEPFRPFIDTYVLDLGLTPENFKKQMITSMSQVIFCDGNKTILDNAIHNFIHTVINALNTGTISLATVEFVHE